MMIFKANQLKYKMTSTIRPPLEGRPGPFVILLFRTGMGKKEVSRAIHILKQIQLCQDIENLHIGIPILYKVYSVEFELAEKKNFRSLPGTVLDFKLKLGNLDRSKQIGPSNVSVQGNFGSQNLYPSRKKFSDHSLGLPMPALEHYHGYMILKS